VRGRLALLALGGVGLAAALRTLPIDLSAVPGAVLRIGLLGFVVICTVHAATTVLCAAAWRSLVQPRPSLRLFCGLRWLRDAGDEMLAVLPGAGSLASLRAMRLAGFPVESAGAALVADLTIEMLGQLVFTALGLAVLLRGASDPHLLHWALVGAGSLAALVAAFVLAQLAGLAGRLEGARAGRMSHRLARALALGREMEGRLRAAYTGRGRTGRALALHVLAWLVGTGEAWIALHRMGASLAPGSVLALESLVFAVRSAAFFVPGSIGVQEGSYALLGAALGLRPEVALAVSLVKRGREIVLGVPALVAWQAIEGRRALARH